jgi:hypothetical protein
LSAPAKKAARNWPYVFVLGGGRVDHAKALDARRWTEVVQAVLKRQAGVAFAPKDLRSSFITFLLSDANSDEALKKAVAHAICAT